MLGMRSKLGCVVVLVLLLGTACGGSEGGSALGEPGEASEVDRVIEIDATDELRFEPSAIEVEEGETIEFRITNVSSATHEFVLGSSHEHSDMGHSSENASGEIEPGGEATVIWSFPEAGETQFACHIADHDKSGMTGTVTVSG